MIVNCCLLFAGLLITWYVSAAAWSISATSWRITLGIIICVKTCTFENHACSAAYQSLNFTSAGWTLCNGFVLHTLELFKRVAAILAFIIVCWHGRFLFLSKAFARHQFWFLAQIQFLICPMPVPNPQAVSRFSQFQPRVEPY